MSSLGNFRELKEKLFYSLHYIVHLFTYKIPYYGLCKLITRLGGDKIWYRFPVKNFYIPKLMPDGNRLLISENVRVVPFTVVQRLGVSY
jgi:hypothetical protein